MRRLWQFSALRVQNAIEPVAIFQNIDATPVRP